MVFAQFTTIAKRLKSADDWRNDESMAGGDAFFEEGIHWLHLAGSLGPRITSIQGFRPAGSVDSPDRRRKSMLVAFRYDNGAVGTLYYSREIPSLLRGLRVSKLMGRGGVISFESNGAAMLVRGRGMPKLVFPGFRDIRGYQAMYRDFVRAIRDAQPPEMSLERAMDDHRLMDQIYASLASPRRFAATKGDSAVRARSFSHVGITVSNFNRAVQFYWDIFGCPLVGVADTPPERVRNVLRGRRSGTAVQDRLDSCAGRRRPRDFRVRPTAAGRRGAVEPGGTDALLPSTFATWIAGTSIS